LRSWISSLAKLVALRNGLPPLLQNQIIDKSQTKGLMKKKTAKMILWLNKMEILERSRQHRIKMPRWHLRFTYYNTGAGRKKLIGLIWPQVRHTYTFLYIGLSCSTTRYQPLVSPFTCFGLLRICF
jgi:hypothetical protein